MKRDPQAFFQVVQIMTGVFAASIFFQTLSSGGTIQELLFPLAVLFWRLCSDFTI